MAKTKTSFFCRNCGSESPKWMGQCPSCREWNTLTEETIVQTKNERLDNQPNWREVGKTSSNGPVGKGPRPIALDQVVAGEVHRLIAPDQELNRVLGGGIVPGSIILFGGQPGIGKSTLLLQLALRLGQRVLYVSGEESEEQIKMRADRLGGASHNCFLLTETNTQKLLQHAAELQPKLLIIDSIQTLASPHVDSMAGTVSQVRECAAELQRFAKETGIPTFLIGHITKEGSIAGPKLLEHIVDAVLQFEGDRNYTYRILRTLKNRFGSTDELGIYQMDGSGLREVSNPSELLLSERDEDLSGSAVCATLEGMRPMLIEVQALVSTAVYGTPQRSATGFDLRRLSMLLAVLEKRAGLPLGNQDVFLNIAGGIRVDDPAIDLSIVAALLSSAMDVTISPEIAFAGEIGLSGEIRAVTRIEQRIQEADRLGFRSIYVSKYNVKGLDPDRYSIRIYTLATVRELYEALFA
ncbi:DNA repair protein RadA [Neolewinella lacunae]|uniref:DNA repair protein RadA n=1 Tax=Neolewinella lacunae TaxID=1517758 RepID=A0A923T955_9BACT|nr:DNA repair protein RadA [Neolewinella lacunae]MBC6994693.1 DNA repair protein RadA [Neolewinella lacunae]MDN3634565.1 DNA repair protein RadA [Neolewinella lacunae]